MPFWMHLSGEIQMVALLPVRYLMQPNLKTFILTLPYTRFIAPSTHLLELAEKTLLKIKETVQIRIHPKNISRDNGKKFSEGKS